MNSFKEGSKEAFLFSLMNEEHKKPNIIRGNSSKVRTVGSSRSRCVSPTKLMNRKSTTSTATTTPSSSTTSVSSSTLLKSLNIENISCSNSDNTNNNSDMIIESVVLTAATSEMESDSTPETANSLEVVDTLCLPNGSSGINTDYQIKIEDASQESVNNTQQQVIDVSSEEPNMTFFVNEFGEIQVYSSNEEKIKTDESNDEVVEVSNNVPPIPSQDTQEDEVVHMSFQAEDGGEYVLLVKNGEIVAVQHPGAKEPSEIDRSSSINEWSIVPQNDTIADDKSIPSNQEENLNDVSQSQSNLSIYQPSLDSSVSTNLVPSTVQVQQEQEFVEFSAQNDVVDTNQYFVTVQLGDGQSVMVPISALESSLGSGDHQIVFNGGDQLFEVISSSTNNNSKVSIPAPSKSAKTPKPKKKPASSRQSISSNSSAAKKNAVNSVTTSSGFLAPSHQMNAIADAIVNQRIHRNNVDSNLSNNNNQMPQPKIFPTYSRTNYSRVEFPQKELKAKPFRFEISESDDENMEICNTFLPLVIENYQSSYKKQFINYKFKKLMLRLFNRNQSSVDLNSDLAKPGEVSAKLPLNHSVESGKAKTVESKRLGETPTKVLTSAASLQCSKCSFNANDRSSLTQHIASSHTEDHPYKCLQCHQRFLYHHSLLNHLKLHSMEQVKPSNVCNQCKMEFHTKTEFETHICLRTVENGSSPSVTKSNVTSISNSSNAICTRPKQHPCMENSCYDWFDNEVDAIRHKLEKHSQEFSEEPYQCQFCTSFFQSKAEALKHLKIHQECNNIAEKNIKENGMKKNYTDSHQTNVNQNSKEIVNVPVIIAPKIQFKLNEASSLQKATTLKNNTNVPQTPCTSSPSRQESTAKPTENEKSLEVNNLITTIQATEVSKEFISLFAKIRDEANEKARQRTKPRDEKTNCISLADSVNSNDAPKSPVIKSPVKIVLMEDIDATRSELEIIAKSIAKKKEPSLDTKDSNSSLEKSTTNRRKSRKVNPSVKPQRSEEDKLLVGSDDEIELVYKPIKKQILEFTESSLSSSEPYTTSINSNSSPIRITRSKLSKNALSCVGKRNSENETNNSPSAKRIC